MTGGGLFSKEKKESDSKHVSYKQTQLIGNKQKAMDNLKTIKGQIAAQIREQ